MGGDPTSVSFLAVSNRTYTIQYTDSLSPVPPVWQKLADVLARPVTRTETIIDPAPHNTVAGERGPDESKRAP